MHPGAAVDEPSLDLPVREMAVLAEQVTDPPGCESSPYAVMAGGGDRDSLTAAPSRPAGPRERCAFPVSYGPG
ncbi:hypothetical protein Asi03nite_02530 [Actinoplanes siamensis]|uniref:Uncharacterized protein n=1 Tax=Actinoplanes siamensis TaxID=1223317 RepID=A0A919N0L1_9ACTN|nr:hypothetical protein Asi03nite_02530 [Actinoplanes siamensis]